MEETIVAISTALGNGSISIIRLSGSKAINIVNSIFKGKDLTLVPSHTINYGHILYENKIIDEVMVSIMRAPKTYTREDVVEINCHGGILVTKNILSVLLKSGARLAQPGEFTKEAFLNGRIDLSQSEAVMDLINAKNNMAIRNSINQISGKTKELIVSLREHLISEIAFIEACLDDPEHYELTDYGETIKDKILFVKNKIIKMIDDSNNGSIIRNGVNCCIIGLPNVGKSSLLNALANKDRAIVTDIAGTTRDVIEEQIMVGDILLNIFDTAGIRETEDVVESIGVKRSIESIENADLILYVLDSSEKLNYENYQIFQKLTGRNVIIVLNKSDKQAAVFIDDIPKEFERIVNISIANNENLDELRTLIVKSINVEDMINDDELFIANERQKELLVDSLTSIENVLETIETGMSEDFLSIDLTAAYEHLGKIIGEEVEEDIINKIFKDFCMGK